MASIKQIEQHAVEKFHLPTGWQAWRWECFPPTADAIYYEMTGGVCPPKLTGKNKGQSNYRKPQAGTKRTVVVTVAEHEAWLLERERTSGLCHQCEGTKEQFAGWSAATGTRTRPCTRCRATGRNPMGTEPGGAQP